MDERKRKIRLGLILQGCVEAALRETSYSTFKANPKYDPDSMTPDVLVPNDIDPTHFIEVTQTEIRDSFRMKTLRYFEAVCEAKVHFGTECISMNILFGDPEAELPANNISLAKAFFDCNLLPRNDCAQADKQALALLEAAALVLAEKEDIPDVRSALGTLVENHKDAIKILAGLLQTSISEATIKSNLVKLWELEKARKTSQAKTEDVLPDAESIKRPVLESLFLNDEEFQELVGGATPATCSAKLLRKLLGCRLVDLKDKADRILLTRVMLMSSDEFAQVLSTTHASKLPSELRDRLIRFGLTESEEGLTHQGLQAQHWAHVSPLQSIISMRADLNLVSRLSTLLGSPFASKLREGCKAIVDTDPSTAAFFADIRDDGRRQAMALHYLAVIAQGSQVLKSALVANVIDANYAGLSHSRCWMADLLAGDVDRPHNDFNRHMTQNASYAKSLKAPFNHLTCRSDFLCARTDLADLFVSPAIAAHSAFATQWGSTWGNEDACALLSYRLFKLRLDGAIKLQSFNPLHVIVKVTCDELELPYEYSGVPNLLSDLTPDVEAVAKFALFKVTVPNGSVLVNAVYVDEYGGLDKAKEWSARGRTFLYRLSQGVVRSDIRDMIFVADGPWKKEAIARLRASGWTICRPQELHSVLSKHKSAAVS